MFGECVYYTEIDKSREKACAKMWKTAVNEFVLTRNDDLTFECHMFSCIYIFVTRYYKCFVSLCKYMSVDLQMYQCCIRNPESV